MVVAAYSVGHGRRPKGCRPAVRWCLPAAAHTGGCCPAELLSDEWLFPPAALPGCCYGVHALCRDAAMAPPPAASLLAALHVVATPGA
eukprot:384468-Alexandrium_andersonii.AAC.1